MLTIDPEYWRATNTSVNVLGCYHGDACLGGLTGSSSYCLAGYEGPCECKTSVLRRKGLRRPFEGSKSHRGSRRAVFFHEEQLHARNTF